MTSILKIKKFFNTIKQNLEVSNSTFVHNNKSKMSYQEAKERIEKIIFCLQKLKEKKLQYFQIKVLIIMLQ